MLLQSLEWIELGAHCCPQSEPSPESERRPLGCSCHEMVRAFPLSNVIDFVASHGLCLGRLEILKVALSRGVDMNRAFADDRRFTLFHYVLKELSPCNGYSDKEFGERADKLCTAVVQHMVQAGQAAPDQKLLADASSGQLFKDILEPWTADDLPKGLEYLKDYASYVCLGLRSMTFYFSRFCLEAVFGPCIASRGKFWVVCKPVIQVRMAAFRQDDDLNCLGFRVDCLLLSRLMARGTISPGCCPKATSTVCKTKDCHTQLSARQTAHDQMLDSTNSRTMHVLPNLWNCSPFLKSPPAVTHGLNSLGSFLRFIMFSFFGEGPAHVSADRLATRIPLD